MNKPGLYLCVYSGKEYLVNIQGLMPCMRITSILDLQKFNKEGKFAGSKSLIKEIEENLDRCTFKYVTFGTECIVKESTTEVPTLVSDSIAGWQVEKFKQYYLNNELSENKLTVFIMKDLRISHSIARSITSEIKQLIKKG